MRRILRVGLLVLAAALVAGTMGLVAWTRIARYPAADAAISIASSARTSQGWYVFEPQGKPVSGLIFYPGGLVDARSYAPLMRELSDAGVLAVIVPMPLELAVLGIERAAAVHEAYPDVSYWAVGGHSLGGAMAAQYAQNNQEVVDAVVLMGSYPAESSDLSGTGLDVLSVVGTQDGLAYRDVLDSVRRLPVDAVVVQLSGGNHAQFGEYGPQQGDGDSTISSKQQQRVTAEAITSFLRERVAP